MRLSLVPVTAAVIIVASIACAGESPALLPNASTPVREAVVPGAISLGSVGARTATESARTFINVNGTAAGAVEQATAPIAKLTTFATFQRWAADGFAIGDAIGTMPDDTIIWTVQFEGLWKPSPQMRNMRFAVVAIDASSGGVVSAAAFQDARIWPRRAGIKQPSNCVVFAPSDVRVVVGPAQAVERVRAATPEGAVSRIQTPWAFDAADAEALRCVVESGGSSVFQYAWLVSVPSAITLRDCSTPTARKTDHSKHCWATVAVHFVEGTTGAVTRIDEREFAGPILTEAQARLVDDAASALGWWDVWARLRSHDDSLVPGHTIDSLVAAADEIRARP